MTDLVAFLFLWNNYDGFSMKDPRAPAPMAFNEVLQGAVLLPIENIVEGESQNLYWQRLLLLLPFFGLHILLSIFNAKKIRN